MRLETFDDWLIDCSFWIPIYDGNVSLVTVSRDLYAKFVIHYSFFPVPLLKRMEDELSSAFFQPETAEGLKESTQAATFDNSEYPLFRNFTVQR